MIFVLKGFSQSGKKGYDAEIFYPFANRMKKTGGSIEYGYVVVVERDSSVTVFDLTDKNKHVEHVVDEVCH